MKKILVLSLALLLVLAGCAGEVNKPGEQEPKTYKIGTAVKNSVVSDDEKFESNVTYVTVAMEDDKFAYVAIDEAQNAITFKGSTIDPFEARKTKKELGDDYGMSAAGKVEWDKQVASLEKFLVGKTLEEVKAGDLASDVNSTVSISVDKFLETIEEAVANAVSVDNVVGVANASSANGDVKDGEAEIGTTVSAVATDKDGNVVYVFVDESQLKATIANGVVTVNPEMRTKGQQKEDYGMSKAGSMEWYLQVKHLTDWALGKNSAAIAKAASESDVTSTVSIYAGNFADTIVKAIAKTK